MKQIPLKGKHGIGKFALVSNEDFERLSSFKFYLAIHGYAVSTQSKKYLHSMILEAPKGFYVDHINRNKLDNRRENLRVLNPQQSSWNLRKPNKLGYRGISYIYAYRNGKKYIREKPYMVHIGTHGKNFKFIGYFANLRHAAMAYDIWAKEWYGNEAQLNFPSSLS